MYGGVTLQYQKLLTILLTITVMMIAICPGGIYAQDDASPVIQFGGGRNFDLESSLDLFVAERLREKGFEVEVTFFADSNFTVEAMTRNDIHEKFKRLLEVSKNYKLHSTPMFMEFAAGLREYKCSPWSTVTFTPNGWKGPCYLIGKKFTWSWDEFWNLTDWEYWESREDRLCQNCLMHSGFEASVVRELPKNPGDMMRLAAWNLLG